MILVCLVWSVTELAADAATLAVQNSQITIAVANNLAAF